MEPQQELISISPNSSIHAFCYESDFFESPWHFHKEYELTYIVRSSGMRYMGNSISDFYPDDLVLTGPDLPHCWKNSQNYTGGASSICIQWKHDALQHFIDESIEFHQIRRLINRTHRGVRIEHEKSDQIKEKLQALLTLEPAPRLIAFLNVLQTIARIPKVEALSGVGNEFVKDRKTDQRIQDILKHIDDHYVHKITIADMSDLTYMTEVSFCKFFKKKFNKSFTNYLNEFRVKKSCQLLRTTDKKLIEIALNCGYENMSFFHRQFKKYLGVTPAEYRQRYS